MQVGMRTAVKTEEEEERNDDGDERFSHFTD